MQRFSRTRIAPTPSGFLHLGNAYSFALTSALARETGASVMLRIDDMDRERVQPEYVADIFETLQFLEIPWDEGPKNPGDFESRFSQRLRLQMYTAALEKLVATGKVYACDCSRSQIQSLHRGIYPGTCRHKNIPLGAPGVAWRVDTDGAAVISVKTLSETKISVLPEEMQHFIVRKKDGFPAYQVTSLADDVYFGVDLVVRGEDLWPSTLAQLFLAQLLDENGFLETTFHHHGLLSDKPGLKLSKSAGDTSVRHWRERGATASDVFREIGEMTGTELSHREDFSRFLHR